MGIGSEVWVDRETGAALLNDTTIANEDIMSSIAAQHPEVTALARWGSNMTNGAGRVGGLFERDRYVTPQYMFDQFKVAYDASESDDVVSGVVESTEALAFNKVTVDAEDEAEEDIWNQIMADVDLDSRLREMWREAFIVSQFYAAVVWGRKDFKVSTKTKAGNKSKKIFKDILVPTGITMLDPLKIVPVGNLMFRGEELAYIADRAQATSFDKVLAGANSSDLVVNQLISGKYEATREEKKYLQNLTGCRDLSNLYLLKKDNVFRFTATRPDYQRFATVRMKSVFELLDIKQQLRQMDRAYLIGGTNFIILVKKGTDDMPAKPAEVTALASQMRNSARMPVIVGDHRLEIEIITPNQDMTLKPERYNTLDARITSRLYQMFMTGNYSSGTKGDDSLKLARVVARGMESRRHMINRCLEQNILKIIYEKNEVFTSMPKLNFHPKRIALDFDPNVSTFMQDLRDRGDISRETLLAQLDLNEAEEARKRERERDQFDDIFAPTIVPFSGNVSIKEGPEGDPRAGGKPTAPPDAKTPTATPKGAGRSGGGNKNGGGANRQSPKSGPPRGPAKEVKK